MVKFLGICDSPQNPKCIVIEYLAGNLLDIIHNGTITINAQTSLFIAFDVASGIDN